MKTKFLIISILLSPLALRAQEESNSNWEGKPTVNLVGYVDAYYAYDFNKPSTGPRQNFIFNFNRHNEVNINLGLLKLEVEHEKYRANLGLQAGTYPQDNYTPEQELMSNIHCANVGISLNKKNNLWLDIGVFPSNLGFESALSIQNWTLSRSLVAESSPYYLAGAKLNYEASENWDFTLLMSNGWQKIRRTPGNSLPSFGTQISYSRGDNFSINWSTYVGPEGSDANRRMRYFNNLYTIINEEKDLSFIAGFDFGHQEDNRNWYAPVVIARYKFNPLYAVALRAEYFKDASEVIIAQTLSNDTDFYGISANFDYNPIPNIALRLEGRYFSGNSNFTFQNVDGGYGDNFTLLASISFLLEKQLQ